MNIYEIVGSEEWIIHFFTSVQDKEFDLKVLKENRKDYYTAREALQLIAESLRDSIINDRLSIMSFPVTNVTDTSVLWLQIIIKDDYTLHCQKDGIDNLAEKTKWVVMSAEKVLHKK